MLLILEGDTKQNFFMQIFFKIKYAEISWNIVFEIYIF